MIRCRCTPIGIFLRIGLLLLILLASACQKQDVPASAPVMPQAVQPRVDGAAATPLRIGMGAMITPQEGYVYYQKFKEYLAAKLGQPVQLVDRGSYDEMNRLLEQGGVDLAFVCAGPYVEAKEKFGLELLAMPLVKGKPEYHSFIIVPSDSHAVNFKDLRGKRFAFTDPKSNSGKLAPEYMLSLMGETPQRFFATTEYTYGHDKSIRAVAEKLVDGAAVDSLIWEYMALKNPDITARTKVVVRSEPYGIPPLVARPGLDPQLKKRLLTILETASQDPDGREILKGMMIDGFVAGDDRNYDTIRMMNSRVNKGETRKK